VGFKTLIPVREYCKLERGIGQCIAIIIIIIIIISIIIIIIIIQEYSCVNSKCIVLQISVDRPLITHKRVIKTVESV
jgi:hypothetical protein